MCVYIYIYICACVYVCMCIYIYIYIYLYTRIFIICYSKCNMHAYIMHTMLLDRASDSISVTLKHAIGKHLDAGSDRTN